MYNITRTVTHIHTVSHTYPPCTVTYRDVQHQPYPQHSCSHTHSTTPAKSAVTANAYAMCRYIVCIRGLCVLVYISGAYVWVYFCGVCVCEYQYTRAYTAHAERKRCAVSLNLVCWWGECGGVHGWGVCMGVCVGVY